MKLEGIKTVVYDLDDTLYDFLSLHPEAYRKMLDKAEELTGVSRETFAASYESTFRELCQSMMEGVVVGAAHSRTLRLCLALEKLDLPLFPTAGILYDVYWNSIFERMEKRPGIEETMQVLKEKGIRIGIGTNMSVGVQYKKIERLGLGKYIDFLLSSEEAVYDKPHPRFFDTVAQKARCERNEILFIGDNKNHDYVPALQAGMHAFWYRPDLSLSIGTEEEGDRIITDHREILQ